ncbi:pilus assembly protein TadG-related protein [Magnetospirillum sp. UT-4]|uniref:TadE/TadG family type IV pilus assembly protein n=1 Tax=Magnetospirillum sp. UT-4 TaxID=2681467 RepID=UPI00138642E7|nr:pilus assembly protein TadG-related protein [Magnetospirillum sp. UT-4]CAA7615360.1 putative Flp pilus assembly protein TadG [Magnetospirillum sp. UT-4]
MATSVRIGSEDGGAVAVMAALVLVPLLAMAGLGVDAARAYLVQARLSQALDAAALAGGRVMFEPERDDDVRRYFRANLPAGYLGARIGDVAIAAGDGGETLTVTASAILDNTLMALVGRPTIEVAAGATVHRASRGMELVLVMDNTGSMLSAGRIDAMKAGARDLVEILYGNRERIPNVWVSLVPYTATVNIGPGNGAWLPPGALAARDYSASPQGWKGCVEARAASGNDTTDAPPAIERFLPFHYPSDSDNHYPPADESTATNTTGNSGRGPNLGCPPSITPMQAEKSRILAAIDAMGPWHRGGTMANLGLAWGWRLLSPRWRGLWSGTTPQLPLEYRTAYMDKVVVLLTDGVNQFYDQPPAGPQGSDYTAYGRLGWGRLGTTSLTTATNRVNQRMAAACEAMKAEGVTLYTITFDVPNATTRALFLGCASRAETYFDSPTNEALRAAFRQIGTTLSNLRLAR